MTEKVESTTRGPKDYFHFGAIFLGTLIALAGVVTVSLRAAICGIVLVAFGMAYFLVTGRRD